MKEYLHGFILYYPNSHTVFCTPFFFVVYEKLANIRALYISPDATPNKSWAYIGTRQHGVSPYAYFLGYALLIIPMAGCGILSLMGA